MGWTAGVLRWLPLLGIVGTAFALTAIFVRSVHQFTVMPDELGYVKQAIEIARTHSLIGPGDFYFNSWAQLFPLISAPIFGTLSMAHAFYVAHTVYALVLASAAVPGYLLARELRLGWFAAYLVAALTVAVPWMAIAGQVMTDVVAYPVFAWATLAMLRALHAPSARRDILALAAIAVAFFARTQFVALGPILLLATVVYEPLLSVAARGAHGLRPAVAEGLRRSFIRHQVLWFASGLALIGALVAGLMGSSHSVYGNYVTALTGDLLPAGTLSAGVEQLDAIVLGTGILPFALAAVWSLATLARPRDPVRLAFAVLLVLIVAVMLVIVGSFQTRFIHSPTDRYLFYLAPLLFTGALTWFVDRRGSVLGTSLVVLAVAWMVLGVSLNDSPVATIINPSFDFDHVFVVQTDRLAHALGIGHLDARVPIAVITSAFVLLAVAARKRLPTRWAISAVMLPLLAFCVLDTGYTMIKLSGELSAVPSSHPAALAWIDRAVPSNAKVGLLLGTTSSTESINWDNWWETNFWNKTVRRAYILPGGDEFAQGFVALTKQDLVDGRLTGLGNVDYLVKLQSDPRFGLRAPIVTSIGDPALYKLLPGAPLLYGTSGVADGGALQVPAHPFVRLFGLGEPTSTVERVTLALALPSPRLACPCALRLGSGYSSAPLGVAAAGGELAVTRTVFVPAHGYAQLNLELEGRRRSDLSSARLVSVEIALESHTP